MDDSLAQKYDRIQQFATRDWLGPSSVSLARLERVKASINNIVPTSSHNLRPTSASRKQETYTQLSTAPPLASKSLQTTATAWGSNTSIPELIKEQAKRQDQRTASTKRPRRPWSGRKTPLNPKPSNGLTSDTGVLQTSTAGIESQKRLKASINVKGAKYDPKSRPPSGRGQTTGAALAELMVGVDALSQKDVENTLEEFIRSQPSPVGRQDLARLSTAYGGDQSLVVPPPAPRASPNADEEVGPSLGETPQLVRRPTPEMLKVTMTIPGMDDATSEDDEDYLYSDRSERESPNLELRSVTSEVSTPVIQSSLFQRDQPTPPMIVSSQGDYGYQEVGVIAADEPRLKTESRPTVRIAEERNVTIDITPRIDLFKPFVPRPPSFKRTQSDLACSVRSSPEPTDKVAARVAPVRAKSARQIRGVKVSMVGVDYGKEGNVGRDGRGLDRRRADVETMMSRMSLSDDETAADLRSADPQSTKAVMQSSAKANYYELSRDSAVSGRQPALLTTKTILLGENGLIEAKSVSAIVPPARSQRSALSRQDKSASGRDSEGQLRTHSAVRRPIMKTTNTVSFAGPPRPESRMGYRHGKLEGPTTQAEATQETSPVCSRPISAPSRSRDAGPTSGRKRLATMTRRLHSAKQPNELGGGQTLDAVGVTPVKKRSVDYRRNQRAVEALRAGTLNRDKKYTKQVGAVEKLKTTSWKPKTPATESSEDEEPQVVPMSAQEREMEEMHQKLLAKGLNVSAHTLARGLLPPTVKEYDECISALPAKSSVGLLSQPEEWLGQLFQKYKLAERALYNANERMAAQNEAKSKRLPLKRKVKKKKKIRKGSAIKTTKSSSSGTVT